MSAGMDADAVVDICSDVADCLNESEAGGIVD